MKGSTRIALLALRASAAVAVAGPDTPPEFTHPDRLLGAPAK